MKKYIKNPVCFAMAILVSLFAFQTNPKPVFAAGPLYVSTSGYDSNSCTSPSAPCATIQGAVDKASSGDTIKIAMGTYTSSNENVILLEKNLSLSGGWDASFNNQTGMSTVSGNSTQRELYVVGVTARIEYFILQNGKTGIYNSGNLTIDHIVVQNNHGEPYCWSSGVSNFGTIIINNSRITGNDCQETGYGGGLFNGWYSASATIINSVIDHNEAAVGGGIFNGRSLVIINSTLSNNSIHGSFSNSQGGGI